MSVDWVMSLDPHWFSTIFGHVIIGGQGLGALAFTLVVLALLVEDEPFAGVVKPAEFHDLGKLMFAFVLLWAYLAFSQLIIIWSGNLPEEIPFYLERLRGRWALVAASRCCRPVRPAVPAAAVARPEAHAAPRSAVASCILSCASSTPSG